VAEPFIGEIKVISFNYAPKGWTFCNGQLLSIAQNQALFSILGTTYGGDGRVNFALPNLQTRVPVHVGSGVTLGETAGETAHTLTLQELPGHNHRPVGSSANADQSTPGGNLWAANAYATYSPTPGTAMNLATVLSAGGSQPHDNMPPYLVLNFIIALEGIFPSR